MFRNMNNFRKPVFNTLWIMLLAGLVVGWAQANDINSVEDGWNYFKGWSDKTAECARSGDGQDGEPLPYEECLRGGDGEIGEIDIELPGGNNPELDIDFTKITENLGNIATKPSDDDAVYDRDEWNHWVGSPCNARETALMEQAVEYELREGSECRIDVGLWITPYSGAEITNPSAIDMDHVIPLAYAAENGGNEWSLSKKEEFANDPINLLATSPKENRSKGKRGPSEYMPPLESYHCEYAVAWVEVSFKYELSMPEEDKNRLTEALGTC